MELASVVPEVVPTTGAHTRKRSKKRVVRFTTSTCGHFLPVSSPKIDRRGEVRGHIGERGERGKSRVKAMTCGDGEKIAARPPGRLGLGSVLGLGPCWLAPPALADLENGFALIALCPQFGGVYIPSFFLSCENGMWWPLFFWLYLLTL